MKLYVWNTSRCVYNFGAFIKARDEASNLFRKIGKQLEPGEKYEVELSDAEFKLLKTNPIIKRLFASQGLSTPKHILISDTPITKDKGVGSRVDQVKQQEKIIDIQKEKEDKTIAEALGGDAEVESTSKKSPVIKSNKTR